LRRGLAYENYKVTATADDRVGLSAARDNPPDLVVLDWMMPGMDGLEVCRRLRAASNVPILMLTAKDFGIDRVIGLETGADDYSSSPSHFPSYWRAFMLYCGARRQVPNRRYCVMRICNWTPATRWQSALIAHLN